MIESNNKKNRKSFFLVATIGAFLILNFQNCSNVHDHVQQSESASRAAEFQVAVQRVLSQNCASCHSANSSDFNVMDDEAMISKNLIVPGKPQESPLYLAVVDGIEPQGGPVLSLEDVQVIRQWIISLDDEDGNGGYIGYVPPELGGPTTVSLRKIYADIIQPNCRSCHGPGGSKADTPFNELPTDLIPCGAWQCKFEFTVPTNHWTGWPEQNASKWRVERLRYK